MTRLDLYVVIHESPMGTRDDGTERICYTAASVFHARPPVIHLAACQEFGRSQGDDGRYFIARVTEIPDPEPAVGP